MQLAFIWSAAEDRPLNIDVALEQRTIDQWQIEYPFLPMLEPAGVEKP